LERAVFDRLMLEQLPDLLRFAIRLTGRAAEGEDLLHDSIVLAVEASKTLRDAKGLRPWMFRIVINCFRDDRRRRRPDEQFSAAHDAAASASGEPAQAAAAAELAERVARAVSSLPPRQREVLVLIAYESVSPSKTAAILGVSEQSVRTNLHLAREKLRRKLKANLLPGNRHDRSS